MIGDGQRGAEPVRGRAPGAMQVDGDLIDDELFPRPTWRQRCELISTCSPVGVVGCISGVGAAGHLDHHLRLRRLCRVHHPLQLDQPITQRGVTELPHRS